MKLSLALALATALLLIGAAQAATTAEPTPTPSMTKPTKPQPTRTQSAKPHTTAAGFWEEADDKGVVGAWFLFEEKEGFFNGRLVKAFPKPGDPVIETCTKCTGDQKNAQMMGLTIVNGMKRNGLVYKDGSILDPRDGSVYHAQMKMSPDGKTLDVRGYLLMPLLGKTQTWKRLPDDAIAPEDIPPEVLATPAAN
jgi:uncharacterized protein (DUF2147 family)